VSTATKPRRVNFREHDIDFKVLLLGSFGLSTWAIAQKTGLSFGQVLYRLKKGSITRSDYRNGQGMAALVINQASQAVEGKLLATLK